jgi:drug/metabolite transporter (DMT)-like permease
VSAARRDLAADLGLVGLAVIWGLNFSVLKVVLRELDPLALNALRFPVAAATLWLLARGAGPVPPLARADLPRIVLLGILGHVVYQLCFIIGIDWTLAGNASLLLATTPVWTMMLSASAGHERPAPLAVLGVAVTVAGMSLVVMGRGEVVDLGSRTVRGDLLMILAAMLWSFYTVGGRGPVARYGALRLTAWTLWVGTPLVVVLGIPSLRATDLRSVTPGAWLGVVYAGVLSISVAYVLWYRGVRRLGNNRTAVYSNLVPVAALLTAWLWLGEVPTPLQGVGAAVVLSGLTLARLAHAPGPSSRRWSSSGNS